MPRQQPILETPILLTHAPQTPVHALVRLSRKQGNTVLLEERINIRHPQSLSLCAQDGVRERVACDPHAPHASRLVIRRDILPPGNTISAMLVRMRDTVTPIPLATDGRFAYFYQVQHELCINPHPAPPPNLQGHIRINGTNPLLFNDPRYKLEIWFKEGEVQSPALNPPPPNPSPQDSPQPNPSKKMRSMEEEDISYLS